MPSIAKLALPTLRRSLSSFFDHLKVITSQPDEAETLKDNELEHYNLVSLPQWRIPDLQYAELFDSWQPSTAESTSTDSQKFEMSTGANERKVNNNQEGISRQSCHSIGTMTYNEMVTARIGVPCKGLETYFTLERSASKKNSVARSKSASHVEDSFSQLKIWAGLLVALTPKAASPRPRCLLDNNEKDGEEDCLKRYLSREVELVRLAAESIPNVKKFHRKKTLLRLIYQTSFWDNYKHLEMEIILFHADFDFIRQTILRTCISVAHKVGVVDRFLSRAQNGLAEYRSLFERLQHIRNTSEEIGLCHHGSHLLNAQRNFKLAESGYKLLIVQASKLDNIRIESDHNLFVLTQCLLVNKIHQIQYFEILRKCDIFQNKYAVFDILMKQYYQPLIKHFQRLKSDFVLEEFYDKMILPFQEALTKAVQDNYEAHQTMNETIHYQRALSQLSLEIKAILTRKEEQLPRKIFIDGILREADTDKLEKLKRWRTRSPERIGAQFF